MNIIKKRIFIVLILCLTLIGFNSRAYAAETKDGIYCEILTNKSSYDENEKVELKLYPLSRTF
jgi:hypothetical protein